MAVWSGGEQYLPGLHDLSAEMREGLTMGPAGHGSAVATDVLVAGSLEGTLCV